MVTYKNYTYQKLNDGRVLASMPTVGDMIFENETEFKAYIDGYLITKKFFVEIEKELRHAVTKHPKFCDHFIDESARTWAEAEMRIKARNSQPPEYADCVLMEEVAEAFSSYSKGDLEHALQEFAQCVAVAIRCMDYVMKKMDEKEKGSK